MSNRNVESWEICWNDQEQVLLLFITADGHELHYVFDAKQTRVFIAALAGSSASISFSSITFKEAAEEFINRS